jgi:hypothetical protein
MICIILGFIQFNFEMTKNEKKKPGPLENLSPEERLLRYSFLMNFKKESEIKTKRLAAQWNADQRGVASMVNNAKRSKRLYKDMREAGYQKDEFPRWWFNPDSEVNENIPDNIEISEDKAKSKSEPEEIEKLYAIPPRNFVLKKDVQSNSPTDDTISERIASQDLGNPGEKPSNLGSAGFTDAEIQILNDNSIIEISPGRWMRMEEQSNGSIVLTSVDPRKELTKVRREFEGDKLMDSVGDNLIKQLSVSTKAIFRKVAFNPSVFQCWTFIANAFDEETGDPYIPADWDFGDFVSNCVLWTSENLYGVVPTILFNRPSRYTKLKELRQRSKNKYYSYEGEKSIPLSSLDLPRRNQSQPQLNQENEK